MTDPYFGRILSAIMKKYLSLIPLLGVLALPGVAYAQGDAATNQEDAADRLDALELEVEEYMTALRERARAAAEKAGVNYVATYANPNHHRPFYRNGIEADRDPMGRS